MLLMFAKVLMMTDEYFRKISFSQKVQLISRCLGLRDPAIVQGMYIFKNPGIGTQQTTVNVMFIATYLHDC